MPHHRKLAWGWIVDLRRVRLPPLPPAAPKQVEERLKLGANGIQSISLTIIVADIVIPVLNPGHQVALWIHVVAMIPAWIGLAVAQLLLRYIPGPVPAKDEKNV